MNEDNVTCEKKPIPKVDKLPPWKVLLHNDNVNTAQNVIDRVQEILKFDEKKAVRTVLKAHETGISLLLTTHQEKAELIVEMFDSYKIYVSAEEA